MHVIVIAVNMVSVDTLAFSIAKRGIAIAQIGRDSIREGIRTTKTNIPGEIGIHIGAESCGIVPTPVID